jgi:hypothetical protein
MSRLAQSVQKAAEEMRAEAKKANRKALKKEATRVGYDEEQDGHHFDGPTDVELHEDDNSDNNDSELPEPPEQLEPTGSNDAPAGADNKGETKRKTVAKKKAAAAKSPKAAKPKAAKAAKPKGARKPREKKVASGKIKSISATGTTYITLEFEEGKIVLSPTSNREQNRDIATKALKALL